MTFSFSCVSYLYKKSADLFSLVSGLCTTLLSSRRSPTPAQAWLLKNWFYLLGVLPFFFFTNFFQFSCSYCQRRVAQTNHFPWGSKAVYPRVHFSASHWASDSLFLWRFDVQSYLNKGCDSKSVNLNKKEQSYLFK